MADPLLSYASEIAPVQPTTRFFDPAPGLGLMQRYGMSGASRAFAEDALKSANEIDKAANYDPINRRNDLERHEWNREVKGRNDVEYSRKKEQEAAFGEFAKTVYGLDFDNDSDAEKKLGEMASDPLLADYEPARAILNHRLGEAETRRREKLIQADKENTLEWKVAEVGIKPSDLLGDDGKLDANKGAEAFRRLAEAQAQGKQGEKDYEGRLKFYNGDKDVADAATADQVQPLYDIRRKVFLESGAPLAISTAPPEEGKPSEFDTLLAEAPALTPDAFVARMMRYDASAESLAGLSETERIVKIMSKGGDTRDPKLVPMVKAAMDLFNAAHARGRLPARAKKPTTPAGPTPDPIRQRLEAAKIQAQQPTQQ